MEEYGYVRVSDISQNENRQMISMAEQGVPEKNIYVDKKSGKDFERKAYRAMLRRLRPGDCVVLSSLDRLGRDYAAILEQWQLITKEKGADIVVLDMPGLLDTREKDRDLTGRLISDIVLQLLSYCAQKDRENIRRRQAEGVAAAKARGVVFGRPMKDVPDNFGALVRQWERKQLTFDEVLAQCGGMSQAFITACATTGLRRQRNPNLAVSMFSGDGLSRYKKVYLFIATFERLNTMILAQKSPDCKPFFKIIWRIAFEFWQVCSLLAGTGTFLKRYTILERSRAGSRQYKPACITE